MFDNFLIEKMGLYNNYDKNKKTNCILKTCLVMVGSYCWTMLTKKLENQQLLNKLGPFELHIFFLGVWCSVSKCIVNSSLVLKTLPHIWQVTSFGVGLPIGWSEGCWSGDSKEPSGGDGATKSLNDSFGFFSYGKSGSVKILPIIQGVYAFLKHLWLPNDNNVKVGLS